MSQSDASSPPPRMNDSVPSSFDDTPDFFEERRLGKLWRRLKEEPLIPIGGLATCYALYQATKSIRQGDHHQTNRMFRARIYAQGFTLVAIVAGSIFYKDDRLKRKKYEVAVEDKKAAEKRDKWIAELEARDREDREWRERFEGISQKARDAEAAARQSTDHMANKVESTAQDAKSRAEKAGATAKAKLEKTFKSSSVYEGLRREAGGEIPWIWRTREAWRRL